MTDLHTWSETAGSNNSASPAGAPELMLPSGLNDTLREVMGGAAREFNRSHPTIASAGSQPAYTLTYTTAPAAYAQGLMFAFKVHSAPTGSVTVNVNSLGAKKVYDNTGTTQLGSGAWAANQRVVIAYDASLDSAAGGFLVVSDGRSLVAGSGIGVAGTTISLDVNGLTADSSPDVAADYALTYDASASAAKKVLLNLIAPAAATQANQETATSTTTYVSPGRQQYHPSAAKAWCLFDGTGTPAVTGTPYNVSSITDNGTGDHTVSWTTAFSSANYAVVAMNNGWTGFHAPVTTIRALATGSVRLYSLSEVSSTATAQDFSAICVAAFGDQ